ncbi:molybdopterin dinucleotide binding domain-containing protein [Salipiger pallidus]|uniref:molybdopterin dinucleotide binding domain-containing protein n=1 Tax=Salipiger pallidus TaxID=1775170 RepID=UPI001E569D29|nr:molybdopterin dinucleotide binding domain-containing protein [Salipiger pallidus]
MTRTALSPRRSAHPAEPFLDIRLDDATRLGLNAATLVKVPNPEGTAILRARIPDAIQQGDVFASIHWTGETAPSGRIDAVVAAVTHPVSVHPESKASVVALEKFSPSWYGFSVSATELDPQAMSHATTRQAPVNWARARTPNGSPADFAGSVATDDREAAARAVLPAGCAYAVARGYPQEPCPHRAERRWTAGGSPFRRPRATGVETRSPRHPAWRRCLRRLTRSRPLVCSCFNVGVNAIITTIEDQGLMSAEAIGTALEAETNCGSCPRALAAILTKVQLKEAAE